MEFVQPIRDRKDIDHMKKYLRGSNLRDYCLFVLGINSGLRISDLLKLRIEDVLDEHDKLKDRITLREKKTGKANDFPIGDNAKKALKEYLASRDWKEQISKYKEPLFPSRIGNDSISRIQAYRILNQAAQAIKLGVRIGTHTMRKTFAYHAYVDGKDISLIQDLLNHSSPSVTLRYIGITQEDRDQVYLSINL